MEHFTNTNNEIWKDIEGYEGLYEVSNLGRVKSFDRIDRLGRLKPGKILRPIMSGGYIRVNLCKEGKRKLFFVHRLVAYAFIPNPEGLPMINHKDENPSDNRVDNLEWCDSKYNNNYGTRNERMVQTRISNGLADPELCGLEDWNKRQRLWRQKNQERILEYQRKYKQDNREKMMEYQQEYYQKNREKRIEYQREYRQENQEKIRERKREYQQKNRERLKEYQREWYRRKKKNNKPSEESLW